MNSKVAPKGTSGNDKRRQQRKESARVSHLLQNDVIQLFENNVAQVLDCDTQLCKQYSWTRK